MEYQLCAGRTGIQHNLCYYASLLKHRCIWCHVPCEQASNELLVTQEIDSDIPNNDDESYTGQDSSNYTIDTYQWDESVTEKYSSDIVTDITTTGSDTTDIARDTTKTGMDTTYTVRETTETESDTTDLDSDTTETSKDTTDNGEDTTGTGEDTTDTGSDTTNTEKETPHTGKDNPTSKQTNTNDKDIKSGNGADDITLTQEEDVLESIDTKLSNIDDSKTTSNTLSTGYSFSRVDVKTIEELMNKRKAEYSNQLHKLEMQLLKLENKLLSESLDKNSDTAVCSKLENQILKLENELLKINQSFSALNDENVMLREKQQSQDRALDIVIKEDKDARHDVFVENTTILETVINGQQSKITELSDMLKQQSVSMESLDERSRHLEEHNRYLYEALLNQSRTMTEMMQNFEEMRKEREQMRTIDIIAQALAAAKQETLDTQPPDIKVKWNGIAKQEHSEVNSNVERPHADSNESDLTAEAAAAPEPALSISNDMNEILEKIDMGNIKEISSSGNDIENIIKGPEGDMDIEGNVSDDSTTKMPMVLGKRSKKLKNTKGQQRKTKIVNVEHGGIDVNSINSHETVETIADAKTQDKYAVKPRQAASKTKKKKAIKKKVIKPQTIKKATEDAANSLTNERNEEEAGTKILKKIKKGSKKLKSKPKVNKEVGKNENIPRTDSNTKKTTNTGKTIMTQKKKHGKIDNKKKGIKTGGKKKKTKSGKEAAPVEQSTFDIPETPRYKDSRYSGVRGK